MIGSSVYVAQDINMWPYMLLNQSFCFIKLSILKEIIGQLVFEFLMNIAMGKMHPWYPAGSAGMMG